MEVRSGDEAAFRQIYEQVFPVVMKVAYHVTYNLDVSQDICQDAFIRFFDRNMVFESADDAKFWLIRVVKNLAINQVKRKAREAASIEKLKRVGPSVTLGDGESALLFEESTERVRKAVASLSEKYKTVIVLKEYAGLDYQQISKVLNISKSNVKIRVHRARKELETRLEKED